MPPYNRSPREEGGKGYNEKPKDRDIFENADTRFPFTQKSMEGEKAQRQQKKEGSQENPERQKLTQCLSQATYQDNAHAECVSGEGWFFPTDEVAMPKHTPVCSREDRHQKGKANENNLLNMKSTVKGNREMQGGGEGIHKGNPTPQEPTNKTKTPHAIEARCQSQDEEAQSEQAARAQPPEPAQFEVHPLMEEGQQNKWKEVKKRGKNKFGNPQNPPSKKPCIKPHCLPENPFVLKVYGAMPYQAPPGSNQRPSTTTALSTSLRLVRPNHIYLIKTVSKILPNSKSRTRTRRPKHK